MNVRIPISWPPSDDSTLLIPVRIATGEDPDEQHAVEAETPWTATAPTASSRRRRSSMNLPTQTATMAPENESR